MAVAVPVVHLAVWAGVTCAAVAPTPGGADLPDIFSLDAARFRAELQSALPELRVAGVQGLSHLRHHTFEADLIRALRDRDARVRREAALGLARLGRRASVPPLIDLLADYMHEVRAQAALALARITGYTPPADKQRAIEHWRAWWHRMTPDQREEELIGRLGDPGRRVGALRALRHLGGSRTEAALLALGQATRLPRPHLRLLVAAVEPVATAESLPFLKRYCGGIPAAAWALGNIGGPEAEEILVTALREPQLDVLANLDRLRSTRVFPHAPQLVQAFGFVSYRYQPDDLHGPPTPTQRLATRLLIRTGRAPEIVDLVLAKLDGRPVTIAKLDDPTIQALQKLVDDMGDELRPGFRRAGGHAKSIPLCAMSHLVRDPTLIWRLIALLDHPAHVVRVYAATALGRLGAPRAVGPITAILREGYPFSDVTSPVSGKHSPAYGRRVRWKGYLAMALGRIGSDAAREALEQLVVDSSVPRDIRFGAAVGLGMIGSEKSLDALTEAKRNDLVRWIRETAGQSLREIAIRQQSDYALAGEGRT